MSSLRQVFTHEAGHFVYGKRVEGVPTTAIVIHIFDDGDRLKIRGDTFKIGPESFYESFWREQEDQEHFKTLWASLCGQMAGHAAEMSLWDEELESDGIDATDTDAYIEHVRKDTLLLDDASGSDLFRTELYAAPLAMFLSSDKGKSLEWTQEYREKIEGRDSLGAVFLEEAWDSMDMDDVAYLTDALIEKYNAAQESSTGRASVVSVIMQDDEIEATIESRRSEFIKMMKG